MEEDETFDEFYAKLRDIVNLALNPGDHIPKPKIVRKVLRSLLPFVLPFKLRRTGLPAVLVKVLPLAFFINFLNYLVM